MPDITADTSPIAPRLNWRRWKRGGGQYGWTEDAGQIYSYNRLPSEARTTDGSYLLTDFHWRNGRTAIVKSAQAAKALAETWLAQGPARDGFARMRAAWGHWHAGVPEGMVGVFVICPDGTGDHRLVTAETYQAAYADEESRIAVTDLLGVFDEGAQTKRVGAPVGE